jgi:hypothetical protein
MKMLQGFLKLFLLLVSIQLFSSCQYYKATNQNISTNYKKSSITDSLAKTDRYFILRNGSASYNMNNLVLSGDKKSVTFIVDSVGENHMKHIQNGKEKYTYDKNLSEDQVLNEVHFFITPDKNIPQNGEYTLDLDKIIKIEVIEKDKKRNANTIVIATIGITLGVLAIAAIIIAATKSSCPFVSAYNGTEFTLQGEIYGGAIYPQLARHDYLPLDIKPMPDGNLQLKISNELKENQFTDLAELLEITHDKNTLVYADEYGTLSAITSPVNPLAACLSNGKDVTAFLEKPNDNALLYMNDSSNSTNELVLTFDNAQHKKHGKLLLNLKNSYFLDLLYGELAKGFGTYYATYKEKQKAKPSSELIAWGKEQHIPLSVYAKSGNDWVKITDISTIGPVATRNIVIPCNLPDTGEPITQIKLSAGFLFWEIDYAAIDYSENNSFSVKHLLPASATDENNKDVLQILMKEDGNYLSQPEIGNVATLTFKPGKTLAHEVHSYILHSKGYYEHIRQFDNKPDMAFLKQFKKPNSFPKFGLQLYKKMSDDQIRSLAKTK